MKKIKEIEWAVEGKWYRLPRNKIVGVCCRCGAEDEIELMVVDRKRKKVMTQYTPLIRFKLHKKPNKLKKIKI